MKVKATKRGYYCRIREPGEVFDYPIKPGDDMPSWMVKVEEKQETVTDAEPESDDEDSELLD